MPSEASYCAACGSKVPAPSLESQVESLRQQVARLEAELKSLRSDVAGVRIPDTALMSSDFWTRAWAVFGHALAPNVALSIILYVLLFALVGVASLGR